MSPRFLVLVALPVVVTSLAFVSVMSGGRLYRDVHQRPKRRRGPQGPVLVCRSCGNAVPLTDELREMLRSGPTPCPACRRGVFTKAW